MASSSISIPGVQIHAGLNLKELLAAISLADSIVLHAAIYSNFATNAVGALIQKKLNDGALTQLTLIELIPQSTTWHNEFCRVLRPDMSKKKVEALYQASYKWTEALQVGFPNIVHRIQTQALPFQPILLIGDQLFVGHYAHDLLTSAEGMWVEFDSVKMGLTPGTLVHWFNDGMPEQALSPTQMALGRYIEECRQLVQQAPIDITEERLQ